ncbi:MAG TPA: cbb3-type cytochrome oxidase assembly protein CcoS [Thiobacillaceae bacterium]|nr:cbb3-type cytochrome oxidase assembly protein CcoS [Thiobacillaceae bacterium]
MEILYLLIPMSVALVAVIALALLWAVKSGQFEDMEGPAHRILMDEDDAVPEKSDITTSQYRDEAKENK